MTGSFVRRKTREKIEENKFVKRVESHGWICYKLAMAGPFGKAGLNDRVVFADYGVTALFEFKKDGEEARSLQRYQHRRLKKMDHSTYVVHRSDEAFAVLKQLVENARIVSVRKKLAKDINKVARRVIAFNRKKAAI